MNKLFGLKSLYYKILQNNIKKKIILSNWGNLAKKAILPQIFYNNKLNCYVIEISYIFRGKFRLKLRKININYCLKKWLIHLDEELFFLKKNFRLGWC